MVDRQELEQEIVFELVSLKKAELDFERRFKTLLTRLEPTTSLASYLADLDAKAGRLEVLLESLPADDA